jgi:hypothetical protein
MHFAGIGLLLAIGYSLAWFFVATILCMVSGGRTLSMKIQMAIVLGVLSVIFHAVIYKLMQYV